MFTEEIDCAHCDFRQPLYRTKGADGPDKKCNYVAYRDMKVRSWVRSIINCTFGITSKQLTKQK
jgi:hypothetical protein